MSTMTMTTGTRDLRANRQTATSSNRFARRLWGGLAAACLFFVLGVSPVNATVFITVNNSSAPVGGTGSFDVVLQNTGASAINVAGFAFELSVTGSPIQFTNATTNTVPAYIFGTLQTPPFTNPVFPPNNQHFVASDIIFSPSSVPVGANTTVGLGFVTYSVSASATPGIVPLVLGAGTSLSDAAGAPITFTGQNGQITINGAGPGTPEPSSVLLGGFGAALIGVASFVRGRRFGRALSGSASAS
jgi:hypothetical protein